MSTERHVIWQVADSLQMDLRAATAKLVELRAKLAGLDLPEAAFVCCPTCEVQLKGPRSLAEHLYNVHEGPEPDHYVLAEANSEEAA